MTQPIDNTPFLLGVHEILSTGEALLVRLDENAITDAQKETMVHIHTVIEVQAALIRKLVDHQLELTESLDRMANKLNI